MKGEIVMTNPLLAIIPLGVTLFTLVVILFRGEIRRALARATRNFGQSAPVMGLPGQAGSVPNVKPVTSWDQEAARARMKQLDLAIAATRAELDTNPAEHVAAWRHLSRAYG